jgi:hypothetical protein
MSEETSRSLKYTQISSHREGNIIQKSTLAGLILFTFAEMEYFPKYFNMWNITSISMSSAYSKMLFQLLWLQRSSRAILVGDEQEYRNPTARIEE